MKKYLFLIIIYFIFSSYCFGAEILKTVEEDGNGDYTTLEACMNGNEQDLTDATPDYFVAKICGTDLAGNGWNSADTTAVDIDNWATASASYIYIYTTATGRHSGTYPTSVAYRLELAGNPCIDVDEDFVRIEGLSIYNTAATNYRYGLIYSNTASGDIRFSYNILKGVITNTTYGIYSDTCFDGTDIKIWNNIIYDWGSTGLYMDNYHNSAGEFVLYNNTISSCAVTGIYFKNTAANADKYLINNAIQNSNACYTLTLANGTLTQTTNLAEDATSPNDAYDNVDLSAVFADEANDDYTIDAANATLDDGTNLSADGIWPFSDDIEGTTRVDWYIGASEYVAAVEAGGDAIPQILILDPL
jgi:hypothetical protein